MPYDAPALPFQLGQLDFESAAFRQWLSDVDDRRRQMRVFERPLILLGAGSVLAQEFVGWCLAQGRVLAMVDNTRAGQSLDGVPIIGDPDLRDCLDKAPQAAGVLCCGSENAIAHFQGLWGQRPQPLISYFEVMSLWPEGTLPGHRFAFQQAFSEMAMVQKAHAAMRAILTDSFSLRTLDAVMLYRLTWDLRHIAKVSKPEKAIYFEPDVMPLHDHEVLIDGGAYDGDTVRDFHAKTQGRYDHIHAFELNPDNAGAFEAKTCDIPNVTLHKMGLWNEAAELGLSPDENASRVSLTGDIRVPLVALDDADVGVPTLIKLDIEGAENQALTGAKRLIRAHRPKLAICAYHLADDFVTLPEKVLSLRNDYKFHLRHYSPILFDTVLYAT